MKTIINAKIITKDEVLEGYVLTFDEKIISISQKVPQNIEIIDANGLYLSAGFIDIHIHGSNGYDVMDGTVEALDGIAKSILQTGTTSFLATTMTMSSEDIHKALLNVQNFKAKGGAKVLGTHLEGPFINTIKHGAQNAAHIQKPNRELIEPYMDSVKMITLAPEVEGGKAFVEYLSAEYPHILLSIGHSDASYEEAKKSFTWGVSHATHLFNAMNPLHHREPGIVGAVLENDEVSCDIIPDLIHIHPSFFNLLYKLKKEQLVLVTDAMRAGCLHCGISEVGGQKVIVKDGEARLEDGTLAGSVLKMNEALKNFYEHTEITLPDLLSIVTNIPAKRLGFNKGVLEKGYEADLVLFDEAFEIHKVYVDGNIVFKH
ncbi:MAG: N-acetylglucosamine-6-phosphate deacetylase (EC [uncultured Sulfurovum sp.]|uniref:N-acetylglucosamine-6-phosphate deacetylase (EC) n=1 Tax=uncultured Sulfurovum sp. TaxID=269237 RepID=A0A6S6TG91_9BACT|nr:MAG: N-acetylglucosamine-6-phosphate deacetylase (EC [uncultured Sulfurovum sp.]